MSEIRIAVVDYGMGNIQSVVKAFARYGPRVLLTADPAEIRSADALVLPGDGAFGAAMENLHRLRLIPVLEEFVRLRKWLFGICVGFQILFSESEEFGAHVGLGIFPGKVRRFAGNVTIPHMGWNDVEIADPSHPLLQGLPKRPLFYFIHSYYADCPDSAYILGRCEYHRTFAAVVGRDRIFGTQFHPEKSHSDGLKIIENLLACIGREAA